ncbi:MAG TPA: hypothetical protein DCM14_04255 [Clostridiales bacterium UBA8153]|nr:hypothetical protein [Clostridiales bacterium UBA8153]
MRVLGIILALMLLATAGRPRREVERTELILATADSGRPDVLNPAFEERHPFSVKSIAVGTGEVLRLGEQEKADIRLAPARRP